MWLLVLLLLKFQGTVQDAVLYFPLLLRYVTLKDVFKPRFIWMQGVDRVLKFRKNYPIDVGDLIALEVNKGKCTIVT